MLTSNKRLEKDFLGQKEIPAHVYYGIQTMRAVENFPITGYRIHEDLIKALAMVKKAAAMANMLGHEKGAYIHLSPNSHVNMSQSTNDVFPRAIHIATWVQSGGPNCKRSNG